MKKVFNATYDLMLKEKSFPMNKIYTDITSKCQNFTLVDTLNIKDLDKNKNGKADRREGKDIDHQIPLSKGGTNRKSNLKLESASSNRSFSRNSNHTVKINKPKKK